jgi:regulatory protein
VRSRAGRGHGPVRIRQELRQRGVADGLIGPALAQLEVDWFELAREVRIRRFGSEPPADLKERSRQYRFMQYRGFTNDQIRAATGDD